MKTIQKTSLENIMINNLKISKFIFYFFAIFFIFYQVNLPISLLPIAGHDDGLFMRLGQSIYDGQWLGEFNHFSLMKGAGLPVLLAILGVFKIPILWFYAIFSLLICNYYRIIITGISKNSFIGLFFSLILLFYPGVDPTRVLREPLFSWIAVLAIVMLIDISRKIGNGILCYKLILIIGFILGFSTIVREESIILWLPIFIFLSIIIYKGNFKNKNKIYSIIIFIFALYTPSTAISVINFTKYNLFINNDFAEANFAKSIKLLQSIGSVNTNDHIPVPYEVRAALYQKSKSFSLLYPFLDSDNAPLSGWKRPACEKYPSVCGEYGGGWFFWAYRDAVYMAGYYKSPADAVEFYKQLNLEIENLCSSGALVCRNKILPIQTLSSAQISQLPNDLVASLKIIMLVNAPVFPEMSSMGSSSDLTNYANFLGAGNVIPSGGYSNYNENLASKEVYKFRFSKIIKRVFNFISYSFKYIIIIISFFGFISFLISVYKDKFESNANLLIALIYIIFIGRILVISVASEIGFAEITMAYLGYAGPMLIVASSMALINFYYEIYKHQILRIGN